MGGHAPRALEDSVRPRRSWGASGWPLNFTVSRHRCRVVLSYSGARLRPSWES
jgi:hypothetical protein